MTMDMMTMKDTGLQSVDLVLRSLLASTVLVPALSSIGAPVPQELDDIAQECIKLIAPDPHALGGGCLGLGITIRRLRKWLSRTKPYEEQESELIRTINRLILNSDLFSPLSEMNGQAGFLKVGVKHPASCFILPLMHQANVFLEGSPNSSLNDTRNNITLRFDCPAPGEPWTGNQLRGLLLANFIRVNLMKSRPGNHVVLEGTFNLFSPAVSDAISKACTSISTDSSDKLLLALMNCDPIIRSTLETVVFVKEKDRLLSELKQAGIVIPASSFQYGSIYLALLSELESISARIPGDALETSCLKMLNQKGLRDSMGSDAYRRSKLYHPKLGLPSTLLLEYAMVYLDIRRGLKSETGGMTYYVYHRGACSRKYQAYQLYLDCLPITQENTQNILKFIDYDDLKLPLDGTDGSTSPLLQAVFSAAQQRLAKLVTEEALEHEWSEFDPSSTSAIRQHEITSHVALVTALSAVTCQVLEKKRSSACTIEWSRISGSTLDVGIYIQYVYGRLCGIERQCGLEPLTEADLHAVKFDSIEQETPVLLLAWDLNQYLKIMLIMRSHLEVPESSEFLNHLYRLARRASSSVQGGGMRVKGQAKALARPRLAMVWMTRRVLEDGLQRLGLQPLERM